MAIYRAWWICRWDHRGQIYSIDWVGDLNPGFPHSNPQLWTLSHAASFVFIVEGCENELPCGYYPQNNSTGLHIDLECRKQCFQFLVHCRLDAIFWNKCHDSRKRCLHVALHVPGFLLWVNNIWRTWNCLNYWILCSRLGTPGKIHEFWVFTPLDMKKLGFRCYFCFIC